MKKNTVKNISAVVLAIILMCTLTVSSFAETIQDQVENWLNGAVEEYETAESAEEQAAIQDEVSAWLAENGFGDIDLSTITDTDIGGIVAGLTGDSSIMDSLSGIGSSIADTFNSALDQVMDAISGGLGTSDGSNTATTEPATSPNVIIADTTAESSTSAVGITNVQVSATVPSTQSATEPSTEVATTYNINSATSADIVGSGVTTTTPNNSNEVDAVVSDDSVPTVAVLIVLSVSTIVVIVAMVVFFILKRKY